MKKPTIATINIEGINTTTVVTPELRCLHPKEITDAYSDMIDALIEAHGFIQTKIYLFKEQYPDQVPQNAINKLNKIKQALKKAGCE